MEKYIILFLILGWTFLSIFVIFFLVTTTRLTYRLIRDLLVWQKWIESKREMMTYQDFISILDTYRTIQFRIRILKVVREERLLIASEETEAILSKIALEAEIRQQDNRYKEKDKSFSESKGPHLATANNDDKYKDLITNESPDFVDAIYVLLEDIRSIRQYQ